MDPGDILATIAELAGKRPELIRLVMRAAAIAIVNVQSVEEIRAEPKRRAVKGN